MNQSKGSTANTEADASKDTSKHNPFSNILKSGEADKLGSKSQGKILFEIAQNSGDKQLYFRISGQSGGAGLHSKQWIPCSKLFEVIESQGDKPWKSQVYKSLYSSGSANNQGFCAAIVRGLGLAVKAESSIYLHVVSDKYQDRKKELLGLVNHIKPTKNK
ncbi:hypothetical protein BCU90_23900 [Vibrio lentus]|uniref:hypothetical protein n=1 Tax=Vibrio TaxID=662 RepID=UPI000C84A7B3|nr:hypothetical protein [Vibrio]CAH7355309.1 conserved hypothetical protein [Vibrio chagasii]PMG43567.1 hypothetical protein BCU90_23900 [Vibrio lentus]TDW01365.1 hypothetical protein EDB45_1351 [Vibrio crassostreae]CAK2099552.1 conserved hypothetical protein [Vibrio crassostreae]CAK2112490.1 conserved hypothetical protein [Vibrio crassostreae]